MGHEDAALDILKNTGTADQKLAHWIVNILQEPDYEFQYSQWQVNVSQSKQEQRSDMALYMLACHVVWFRYQGRTTEERLKQAISEYHETKTRGTYYKRKRQKKWW